MGSMLVSSIVEIYRLPIGVVYDLVLKGYLELTVVADAVSRAQLTVKGHVIANRISPGFNYRRYRNGY